MRLAQSPGPAPGPGPGPGPGASWLAPEHWRVVDGLLSHAWATALRNLDPEPAGLPADTPQSSAAAQACGIFCARDGAPIQGLVDHMTALRSPTLQLLQAEPIKLAMSATLWGVCALIDRSIAAAVRGFSGEIDRERNQRLLRLGHDFRAHLNVITMVGEALNGQQAGPQLPSSAGMIQRSSDELKSLLDDLQDTAHATGLHHDVPSCNVASACWEMADRLRTQEGIELEWTGPSLVRGHFDSALVCEALANLIHIAAAPAHAHRTVQVDVEYGGPQVAWVVRGDVQARPRQPDTPASGGHEDQLRLVAAHQIARMHGGELRSIADTPARWFRMELPATPVAPAA